MYISRLLLSNFKNYEDIDVTFSNNVNCLVGNNGVGKTNLLDALYYLSFCKSYFNPVDSLNIRFDADFFAIHGQYSIDEPDSEGSNSVTVSCTLQRGQSKKMKFNKKACTTFAEHIGRLPLVIVTPSDQSLILGGSDVRRKFIDGIISQADRGYLQNLVAYQKALEQRNRLLKQFYENQYFEDDTIAVWDEQLVRYGQPIVSARRQFLVEFMPLFEQYYLLIHPDANSNEKPGIEYLTQLEGDASDFARQLADAHRRDAQVQYTTVGSHKDDLDFSIGQFAVKRFGSQGQQKTFLVSLKFAQYDLMKQDYGFPPILLLDDVFDKLDMERISHLLALVAGNDFGQIFITDSNKVRMQGIVDSITRDRAYFEARGGVFTA